MKTAPFRLMGQPTSHATEGIAILPVQPTSANVAMTSGLQQAVVYTSLACYPLLPVCGQEVMPHQVK